MQFLSQSPVALLKGGSHVNIIRPKVVVSVNVNSRVTQNFVGVSPIQIRAPIQNFSKLTVEIGRRRFKSRHNRRGELLLIVVVVCGACQVLLQCELLVAPTLNHMPRILATCGRKILVTQVEAPAILLCLAG